MHSPSFARFSVILASSVFATACSAGPGPTEDIASGETAITEVCGESADGPVQGVDVSHYQGDFDWAAAHVSFGYAQVGDGTGFLDPTFSENWAKMKSAGVLRGAYQFFEPSESEVEQADILVARVGRLGAGDLPAMLDVEVTDGESGSDIGARIAHWLEVVEAGTGKKPIIYTGSYFWQDHVGDASLGGYPVWIAAYGPACPSLPPGWSGWTFWQYSDGGGALDHDVFNGTLAELKALAGVPSGPPTATPKAPTGCGEVRPGQGLRRGEAYKSCDGRFELAMQGDGNLVLYAEGSSMWDTGTSGSDGFAVVMQTDGNFVLYGSRSDPLWQSRSSGHAGAHLALQDDGNLVVVSTESHALWNSATEVPAAPPKPSACGGLPKETALTIGESETSCDGRFSLVMQGDGNLVLYESGHGALWETGTNGKGGYMAVMQSDGNFVVRDRHRAALWASGSAGHNGAHLAVQTDGNLVVYAAKGGAYYWDSKTEDR